jgi:hypothetical protein
MLHEATCVFSNAYHQTTARKPVHISAAASLVHLSLSIHMYHQAPALRCTCASLPSRIASQALSMWFWWCDRLQLLVSTVMLFIFVRVIKGGGQEILPRHYATKVKGRVQGGTTPRTPKNVTRSSVTCYRCVTCYIFGVARCLGTVYSRKHTGHKFEPLHALSL